MTRRRKYEWLKDAAKLGGTARWEGVSDKERRAYASAIAKQRHAHTEPEARSAAARKAIQARWAKYRALHPLRDQAQVRTKRRSAS